MNDQKIDEEDKLFDSWVDEYFSNISIDLNILRKAFDSLRADK